MNRLEVWLTFPDGEQILAGEIAYPDQRKTHQPGSAFRYAPEFLVHTKAFSLDPKNLPLRPEEYFCERHPEDIHGVFEDSLPDRWGRGLIAKKHLLTITQNRLVMLLKYIRNQGLGALAYKDKIADFDLATHANIVELEQLVQAAHHYEQGVWEHLELERLFQVGSSPGGARPKALVSDNSNFYLAKFPSSRDEWNMVSIEAATLEIARHAGIRVVEGRIFKCGNYDTLLIKRFDISASGGRHHMISMQSMLGDNFYHSYSELVECIRLYSDQADIDLPGFFRQVVFNVLIGNTDDHPKNFTLLHTDKGWMLSPAYDLLPNIGQRPEHAMTFMHTAYPLSKKDLILMGDKMFGLSLQRSRYIYDEVANAVASYIDIYKDFGVPEKQIKAFGIKFR